MSVHYFAAAKAAAGTSQELIEDVPATLADLIALLGSRHAGMTDAGLSLAEVLTQCSFLVDGMRRDQDAALEGASRVDVMPPFAGG
ncbi:MULTISPECIES: MoaD/ThiS family protein [Corynebacterium]|uniref:MoaD/ThiS family protein n=1 Tax=Corynebacterium TaxID=1716 RepID=UPI0018656CEC|nr:MULTISPECIES: MoaD/ThiS family protein [Corynebacterium]